MYDSGIHGHTQVTAKNEREEGLVAAPRILLLAIPTLLGCAKPINFRVYTLLGGLLAHSNNFSLTIC